MPISDPKVVTDYIRAKVEEGRLIKMVPWEASALNIHCSPMDHP